MLTTIEWTGSALRLLDQTRLPGEVVYVDLTTPASVHDAIKRLVVRGAPAIGVAAAFGAYLGVRAAVDATGDTADAALAKLDDTCRYLATARPTAVNLFWALDRVQRVVRGTGVPPVNTAAQATVAARSTGFQPVPDDASAIAQRVLQEAQLMLKEDAQICDQLGEQLLPLLLRHQKFDRPLTLLTHCNAGALATCGIGTATAPMYLAHARGIPLKVYADETRPLLQGARLTATELRRAGIDVTVLCDNMSASLMAGGAVDAVVVGTDRVAADGGVANKVGTLGVAILAKHFGVPFYVAAPTSSIDPHLPHGRDIPIEHRAATEVTRWGGVPTAEDGVAVYNPAFDVTPFELVTAIVTEHGVWKKS
jgi:methylthioribose-1-phosphate isomerase